MQRRALRDFLDVCHSGPVGLDEWLRALTAILGPLLAPCTSVCLSVADIAKARGRVVGTWGTSEIRQGETFSNIPLDKMRLALRPSRVDRLAKAVGLRNLQHPSVRMREYDFIDCLRIAADAAGIKVVATVPLTSSMIVPRFRPLLRLQRQLAGGVLRRASADWSREAALIISEGGRALHCDQAAELLPRVNDFAKAFAGDLKHSNVADPESERLWDELWNGGWSFASVTDTDGKRLLVLRRTHEKGVAALSDYERQALVLAAKGASTKKIAFVLGAPMSTASSALQRALRKVGADNRLFVSGLLTIGSSSRRPT